MFEARKTFAKSLVALALMVAFVGLSSNASATLVWNALVGGAPIGVSYVNFDNLPLGGGGGTSGGITVSFTPDAQAVQGNASGLYAAPYLSNNNGVPFGDPSNGPDATTYLTTGLGRLTMAMPGPEKYLGLLWGSVDNYNTLSFYNGAALAGILTGTDIWAQANGDQGVNGTFYVNIVSDLAFDKVVATSTQYSFEFDNVAYNPFNPVIPEPATLVLCGLGLGLAGLIRRRPRR